jgi:hypothetical protein
LHADAWTEGTMVSELHQRIRLAALAGHELDDIERTIIDAAPISEEEKSAMWLYAQVRVERPSEEPAIPASSAAC